jgi:hypothetical protein
LMMIDASRTGRFLNPIVEGTIVALRAAGDARSGWFGKLNTTVGLTAPLHHDPNPRQPTALEQPALLCVSLKSPSGTIRSVVARSYSLTLGTSNCPSSLVDILSEKQNGTSTRRPHRNPGQAPGQQASRTNTYPCM